MELTLLGTGAPDGLPRPGCPCAACATATGTAARAATAVLIDGVLLLDLTPGPALAAARAGQSLAGVRQVLLSHPRQTPANEAPAGLPNPARVPHDRELALLSGHRVRAVRVDTEGTGYAVTGPGGQRLLYLPPGASPAEPATAASYDMVLLDVIGRPDALAALRGTEAVTGTTDVLAVHLGHGVPPTAELHRRLAAAGARTVPDGQRLIVGEYHAVPDLPRRTLVLGGARSGKSAEAERRLAAFPEVSYVATGGGSGGDQDAEWAARVRAHQQRRPAGWQTVESCDLPPLLAADGPPLLIDCLGLWLTDALDSVGAWDDATWWATGERALRDRIDELLTALRATRRTVVAVSNEVGSGVVPATASGRRFRDALGRLNAAFAAECEHVLLVVAGQPLPLRG